MTDFKQLVSKRESVRHYTERAIDRSLIDCCLDAARLAPSACNSQPWYFLAIDDQKLIRQISAESTSGIYGMNKFIAEAPALIVVITEKSIYKAKLGGMIRNTSYNLIDIGIACDHLTLQAEELGIGSCWIGWFNEKRLKRVLELPKQSKIDLIISLGYKSEDAPDRTKKRKTLDDIRKFL